MANTFPCIFLIIMLDVGPPLYCLKLTRIFDCHSFAGCSRIRSNTFHTLHNILSFKDLAKNNVTSIEPGSLHGSDEKLTSVGVWPSISHTQVERALVLELKILISKLLTIDTFTSTTISI